jgi:hypothetical protein
MLTTSANREEEVYKTEVREKNILLKGNLLKCARNGMDRARCGVKMVTNSLSSSGILIYYFIETRYFQLSSQ